MDGTKNGSFAEQVRRIRAGLIQSAGGALGKVITGYVLKATVLEEAGRWRERLYSPLTTVVLFIEQVLGADHTARMPWHEGWARGWRRGKHPAA